MRNVGAHALTTVGQLVLNRIPEVDSKPADPPTLTWHLPVLTSPPLLPFFTPRHIKIFQACTHSASFCLCPCSVPHNVLRAPKCDSCPWCSPGTAASPQELLRLGATSIMEGVVKETVLGGRMSNAPALNAKTKCKAVFHVIHSYRKTGYQLAAVGFFWGCWKRAWGSTILLILVSPAQEGNMPWLSLKCRWMKSKGSLSSGLVSE